MKEKLQQVREALDDIVSDEIIEENGMIYYKEYHSYKDQIEIYEDRAKQALTALDEVLEMLDSEEMVERVTKAISLDLKSQLDGQDNPPAELYDPLSWNATGGSFDMSDLARAAINAITGK